MAEFAPAYSGLGEEASVEAAGRPADVVLNGITGAVGLRPTLAALDAGTTLALANKESLIIGGPLVLERARPGQLVPVDSEHSAIAQCLRGGSADEVRRLVLTASGGPFRGRSRDQLAEVTPEQALDHPTWDMGPVVTINSATLVNKGLEVIEAHLLFGIPFDRIEVVVHPTSVVHSMVEFVDGSTLVQASPPTMLIPIALGLAWPDRVPEPRRPWTGPGPRPGSSTRSTTRPSPRSRWPGAPGSAAAPPRRSTTRPTRSCVEAFRRGGLRLHRDRAHGRSRAEASRRTLGGGADRRRRARGRRLGPRRGRPTDRRTRETLMTAPALPARRAAVRPCHPGLDRAARARPHDPGQEVRREGHPVLDRLRSDRVEPHPRRDRVRPQGDPARRLRQDRRHAPAGARRSSPTR